MAFEIKSPGRLLREDWSSVRSMAEELYSMYLSKEPTTLTEPLTIAVETGKMAFKIIERAVDGPPVNAQMQPQRPNLTQALRQEQQEAIRPVSLPVPITTNPFSQLPRAATQPPSFGAPLQIPIPLFNGPQPPWKNPVVDIAGPVSLRGPVQFDKTPYVFNQDTGKYDQLKLPDQPPQFSADAFQSAFFGKVLSGKGDTYQVELFRSSPSESLDSSADAVTVKIPLIDPDETIPAGTIIGPLVKLGFGLPATTVPSEVIWTGGDFWFQPAVWIE